MITVLVGSYSRTVCSNGTGIVSKGVVVIVTEAIAIVEVTTVAKLAKPYLA